MRKSVAIAIIIEVGTCRDILPWSFEEDDLVMCEITLGHTWCRWQQPGLAWIRVPNPSKKGSWSAENLQESNHFASYLRVFWDESSTLCPLHVSEFQRVDDLALLKIGSRTYFQTLEKGENMTTHCSTCFFQPISTIKATNHSMKVIASIPWKGKQNFHCSISTPYLCKKKHCSKLRYLFSFLKGVLFLAMPGRERVNVVWFKCTDLRCHDHAALKAAHQGERGMRHVAVVTVLFREKHPPLKQRGQRENQIGHSTNSESGNKKHPELCHELLDFFGIHHDLCKARYLCFISMSLIHFGMLGKLACAAFQRRALFAIVFSSRP